MSAVKYYAKFKNWHHNYRLMKKQKNMRKKMLEYLNSQNNEEKKQLIPFFTRHYFEWIPYFWIDEYDMYDEESYIKIHLDKKMDMYFVDWHGKKLYWKQGTSKRKVLDKVRELYVEQDERSPHKYTTPDSIEGMVVADIGAAEGFYSLDVVDRAEHVYLFESDPGWMKALRATFAPYKDKVTIVPLFVGNRVGDQFTTLDEFFRDKKLDYIKADIEGAECEMLMGGSDVFKNKIKAANICLYHNPEDEVDILDKLKELGFYNLKISPGFLCWPKEALPPEKWLRRGVVFAERKDEMV